MKQLLFFVFFSMCSWQTHSQTPGKISNPESDFEKFWNTFNDNYAFFKLKNVNWDSTYAKYRPLVNPKTTQQELVDLFSKMVDPLQDGHVSISKGEEILYKTKRRSYFKEEFKGFEKEFWQTVYKTTESQNFSEVKGLGPVFKGEHLYYLSQNAEVGYIRITRCFGNVESLFDDKREEQDIKHMLFIFDSLLTVMKDKKALIIDMRSNGGGHGGIELASRFASEKRLTHYKAIRKKGGYDDFTPAIPNYIIPNNGIQFLKKVIILTNDKTASSAEDFTISLYQQQNVTTIGTNTSGMLSDMFGTDLSHNISFTLSNQCYYSTDKKILEDVGVPVKIEMKNSKTDIEKGSDPSILKAIQVINE